MIKSIAVAAILALGLVTPATAQTATVTEDFAGGPINWERTGRLYLRFAVLNSEGTAFLCGAWASSGGPKFTRLNREVLENMRPMVNSRALLQNVSFFNQVSNAHASTNLVGTQATCRSLGVGINEVDFSQLEMNMRKTRF